jgi:hypothetical protein
MGGCSSMAERCERSVKWHLVEGKQAVYDMAEHRCKIS